MPQSSPTEAPKRIARWLDDLKGLPPMRSYADLAGVAERLRRTNPRLTEARANWLATQWSRPREDGRLEILGDPIHLRSTPHLYRKEEVLECWKLIRAPVMWAEGSQNDMSKLWADRYPREDFEARLAVVPRLERHVLAPAGHMVHHDQPEQLALRLEAFLSR